NRTLPLGPRAHHPARAHLAQRLARRSLDPGRRRRARARARRGRHRARDDVSERRADRVGAAAVCGLGPGARAQGAGGGAVCGGGAGRRGL
ncbi:hypothetical protein LTR16_008264, partial [Cryomyces antarcticus]